MVRPKIPRLKHCRKLREDVSTVNNAFSKIMRDDLSLLQIVDVVYASAMTVAKLQGRTISQADRINSAGDLP